MALKGLIRKREADKVEIWAHVCLIDQKGGSLQDLAEITKFLKSKNPESRENAARALATLAYLKMDILSQLEQMVAALEDKDNLKDNPAVIIWICVALAKLGDDAKSALLTLQKLENSTNPDIKAAAKEAIDGVTNKIKKNDDPGLQRKIPKGEAPMKK
jgi:hypothetical protein